MKKFTASFPASNENNWAHGCTRCKYGISAAPDLTGACELYLERLVQHLHGDIAYCDCRAGSRYEVYLRNRRQMLLEEARRSPNMQAHARRLTHPDIETAEYAISNSYGMLKAPTIRWVDAAQPTPAPAPEPTAP